MWDDAVEDVGMRNDGVNDAAMQDTGMRNDAIKSVGMHGGSV